MQCAGLILLVCLVCDCKEWEIFFTMFTDKNFLGFSKTERNEKIPRNNCTS